MNAKEYIPFGKPNFSGGEIAAVTRVMESGWIGMGPETIAFEKEKVCKNIMTLPIGSKMTLDEADYVSAALKNVLK